MESRHHRPQAWQALEADLPSATFFLIISLWRQEGTRMITQAEGPLYL